MSSFCITFFREFKVWLCSSYVTAYSLIMFVVCMVVVMFNLKCMKCLCTFSGICSVLMFFILLILFLILLHVWCSFCSVDDSFGS